MSTETPLNARQWLKENGCEDFSAKGPELSPILEAYARAVLAEAERAHRWIPVSEKLPAIGQAVLFYVAAEKWIESGCLSDACDERDAFWECDRTAPQDEPIQFNVRDERVTHWMPLPEPPTEAADLPGRNAPLSLQISASGKTSRGPTRRELRNRREHE